MAADDVTTDGPPAMVTVTVADGTQVNHEGTVYGPGETFSATEAEVARAVEAGWATLAATMAAVTVEPEAVTVKPEPSGRRKRSA